MSKELQDDARFKVSSNAIECAVEGGTAILDIHNDTYFMLNLTGALVWEGVKSSASVSELCSSVVDRFNISQADCRNDIVSILSLLQSKQLIEAVNESVR